MVLNKGHLTKINKIIGAMSNPNITLALRALVKMCRWEVCEQQAHSDHLPYGQAFTWQQYLTSARQRGLMAKERGELGGLQRKKWKPNALICPHPQT